MDSKVDASKSGVGAVVVAAGRSARMGGADKIFAPLMSKPLISYSIEVFNRIPEVDSVVLVGSPHNVEELRGLARSEGWAKIEDVCVGGRRRQDSVRCGMDRLANIEWIVVHDGARPFVDEDMVRRGLEQAALSGAAAAAVPINDTIKSADGDGLVTRTVSRDGLWSVQTPQVFRRELLAEAHRRVEDSSTDDASMVERVGGAVRLFMGSYHNLKVTTPDDLLLAEGVLRARLSRESP